APPDNGISIADFFATDAQCEAEARAAWDGGREETKAALRQAQSNLVELRARLATAEAAVEELGPARVGSVDGYYGFEGVGEARRYVRRQLVEAQYGVEAQEAVVARLKATPAATFQWTKAYLVDRPTGRVFYSEAEVAEWLTEQAAARGYRTPFVDRLRKRIK